MRQLKITKQVTNRETASLDKYLQEIGKVDLITAEEEVELAQKVKQGDQIGICGNTGCGKSTLVDIMMGLLTPLQGKLLVNNVDLYNQNSYKEMQQWRYSISYVPQNIFLADSSLAQNIAFGIPYNEIDFDMVKFAAKKAQISDFIESTKYGYNSLVGERGILLSGGQIQRVGIARAFYRNSKIIFFDEATSSLDSNTEIKVMNTIHKQNSDITIVLIAHRLSTLSECNKIFHLKNSKINILNSIDEINL